MAIGLITAILLALVLGGAQQLSDPEAQMQAALHEEIVAGNPAGAIEQYKSILAEGGVSRSLAATALLHIGECEEKLGRREDARKTFLRVIKQFGDQRGIAGQARDQLENVSERSDKDSGPSFGLGTTEFPASAAAGKHVKYSGYIKTEGVTRGSAGLWWRVDGEAGGPALGFDNMQDRGATGTKPWTRYEIEMDVPANATHIYFGVLHSGNGDAWFDTLQVELNGAVYTDTTHFDLDFESGWPRGFYTGGKGYRVEIDREVAHTGRQSLHSHFLRKEEGRRDGSSFGAGSATFPLSLAAGKHVKYSGYIKTEGVSGGWAGLWWRVDGEPGTPALAFDNMQDRGASGTTPWTRYEIELDVPAKATHIDFGVLHQGKGDAWFDTLQVELDGVPYMDRENFDFDFESSQLRGFHAVGKGYKLEIDPGVAHTGRQSLKSHYAGGESGEAARLR